MNQLCSLRPLEDKLCFSIVFNINKNGDVLSNWIGKTIIKSKKRFTYQEAQNILDKEKGGFYNDLNILNTISRKLRNKRKELLESLDYVDKVIPEENWDQKLTDVKENDVDVFVMGSDWEGKFDELKKYCKVIYLPRTKGISTTKLKSIVKTK